MGVSTPLLEGVWKYIVLTCWPYVKPFWKGVGHLVSELLGLKSDFSFSFLQLGNIPTGLSKGDTYIHFEDFLIQYVFRSEEKTTSTSSNREGE